MDNLLQFKETLSAVIYASEATDLERVLERIADISRQLLNTKYAALGIPDGGGGLRYFKTSGLSAEQIARIDHKPLGHGLIGAIMRERQVIRLQNMRDDQRSSGFPAHHPMMTSFLGAPIIAGKHLYGMLYLSDKTDGSEFTQDDETLLEIIASYAALAISGAELTEQSNRVKLLEERERIAMELHDGVIQSLYGIGMQVDLIQQTKQHADTQDLTHIVQNLNTVIEDIRTFITHLHQPRETVTIKQCLQAICNRLHIPPEITVTINATETLAPFTQSDFHSICLIVNEAMSNAIRHAQATHITLTASQTASHFIIQVEDNGMGFDSETMLSNQGLGILNMKKRAQLYDGTVQIDSELGSGTTLRIVLPIP